MKNENENKNQPGFMTIFDVTTGTHQIFAMDWILAVAPLFEKSSVIAALEPVLGRTGVTFKDRQGVITNHSMEDWHNILGSKMITEGPIVSVPEKKAIIVPDDQIVSSVVPFKKES